MDYLSKINEHNTYSDYLSKLHPFNKKLVYDEFKPIKHPSKLIIDGVYKIPAGKTVWFIDYQDTFKLNNDKYIILTQMNCAETIGFGYFINEYGTKVGGELDFGIRDLEYCFDTVEEYIKSENEKRLLSTIGLTIIGFKTEGGEVCI